MVVGDLVKSVSCRPRDRRPLDEPSSASNGCECTGVERCAGEGEVILFQRGFNKRKVKSKSAAWVTRCKTRARGQSLTGMTLSGV